MQPLESLKPRISVAPMMDWTVQFFKLFIISTLQENKKAAV